MREKISWIVRKCYFALNERKEREVQVNESKIGRILRNKQTVFPFK